MSQLSLTVTKEQSEWLSRNCALIAAPYSSPTDERGYHSMSQFWNQVVRTLMRKIAGMKQGEIFLEIVNASKRRTIKMNRLYWLWMRVLSQHTGYSKGGLHELLMHRAGFHDIIELAGDVHVIRWSSAKLTVDQFTELMREAEEIADKISCPLPYPEEIRHAA